MNLQDFITKYSGGGVDFDGSFGFQCVDLYRFYVKYVLGVPQSPSVVGAKDIWTTYSKNYYDQIANTPEGIPQPGDIVIWGDTYGPYGHVAIFVKGTATTMTCFSQNDPAGTVCGLKLYRSYRGVLGWLRCKIITGPIAQNLDIRLSILNENDIKTEGDLREVLGGFKELSSVKEDKLNSDKEIDRLRHLIEQDKVDLKMESDANIALKMAYESHLVQIGKALGNGSDLPGILQQISILTSKSDQADKLESQIKVLQKDSADLKAEVTRKDDANKSYSLKIDSLEKELKEIKEILGKWLKVPNLTVSGLVEALHGLTPIEKPIVAKIGDIINSIIKKIWRN